MNIVKILAVLLIGYLFGSIPFALVIGKLFYKTDIRKHGSGNLGGTNAGRVLGKKAGVTVILLDALKAVIAMAIASLFAKEYMIYAGWGAAIGHCYPLFASFKGGKAVATIAGYVLGLCIYGYLPIINVIIPLATFFIILKLTKYVSLSSMIMIGLAAIMSFFTTSNLVVSISILILFLFTTYRHRQNIVRIKNKTESKIKWM